MTYTTHKVGAPNWITHKVGAPNWIKLVGVKDALVRTSPSPNGRYMWQFRKVVSYADTVEAAKEYVEAGAEYFETMRRNPYQA